MSLLLSIELYVRTQLEYGDLDMNTFELCEYYQDHINWTPVQELALDHYFDGTPTLEDEVKIHRTLEKIRGITVFFDENDTFDQRILCLIHGSKKVNFKNCPLSIKLEYRRSSIKKLSLHWLEMQQLGFTHHKQRKDFFKAMKLISKYYVEEPMTIMVNKELSSKWKKPSKYIGSRYIGEPSVFGKPWDDSCGMIACLERKMKLPRMKYGNKRNPVFQMSECLNELYNLTSSYQCKPYPHTVKVYNEPLIDFKGHPCHKIITVDSQENVECPNCQKTTLSGMNCKAQECSHCGCITFVRIIHTPMFGPDQISEPKELEPGSRIVNAHAYFWTN